MCGHCGVTVGSHSPDVWALWGDGGVTFAGFGGTFGESLSADREISWLWRVDLRVDREIGGGETAEKPSFWANWGGTGRCSSQVAQNQGFANNLQGWGIGHPHVGEGSHLGRCVDKTSGCVDKTSGCAGETSGCEDRTSGSLNQSGKSATKSREMTARCRR
jgi:hypothetical protein